jgi:hypothetical protein
MPVHDKLLATAPVAIRNPNGEVMCSSHTAELHPPGLPLAARQVHIVPSLSSQSPLSIGQFCDAGCKVAFDAETVTVSHDNEVLLTGQRTPLTRLWHLDVPAKSDDASPVAPALLATNHSPRNKIEQANSAIGSATPAELVPFAHATLFSPALSALASALAIGCLTDFPGLATKLLLKHPPHSAAMIKGHLDQTRKNQRSTKPTPSTSDSDGPFPASPVDQARSHHCCTAIFEPTGQIHTDQTGRFVTPSSNGNKNCLLVLHDYDSNCILAEAMKNCTANSMLAACQTLHAKLCQSGLRPKPQRLDNECSAIPKQFLTDEAVNFQLVSLHVHRRNAAERCDSDVQESFCCWIVQR